MKYILRILVLPLFLLILLIFHTKEIIKRSYYFILYGGEFIVYERLNQNKLINDVFKEIVKQNHEAS